jgi:hypothetical protein
VTADQTEPQVDQVLVLKILATHRQNRIAQLEESNSIQEAMLISRDEEIESLRAQLAEATSDKVD